MAALVPDNNESPWSDRNLVNVFHGMSGGLPHDPARNNREPNGESELSLIFSQSRAVYPFLLLLAAQFIVGHSLQAVIYLVLSTCIGYINVKFKEQVALKDRQSVYVLYKLTLLNTLLLAFGLYFVFILSRVHVAHRWWFKSQSSDLPLDIPYLLWTTAITDLLTRSLSTIAKLIVSLGLVPHFFACEHCLKSMLSAFMSGLPINDRDADQFVRRVVLVNSTRKRRRVLYACIETFFVMYRSILPIPVWCAYFYSGSIGQLFVCIYLAFKTALVISCFGRFLQSYWSYVNDSLEHGSYYRQEEEDGEGVKSCPICMEPSMNVPVVLDCKHVFCENCISEWLERERTCPVCRSLVNSTYDPSSSFRDGRTFMMPIVM